MKISLNWLADTLPGPIDAQVAADALTHGGLPVESIETHADSVFRRREQAGMIPVEVSEIVDTVLDVEVTSNRGDCLSHIGVARELSALLDRPFQDIQPTVAEAGVAAATAVSVSIEAPALCPHYTARVIRNVKIGPSPVWMQRRLEAVGVRSVNNVVDVTNYVLFELGQPLHAFDFDRLEGRRIVVRLAREGEVLQSLDGHERKLRPDMLVIADAARPAALAGVMGGLWSEVSTQTVNVLLESARFDPLTVRKTARALSMRSDSSYRFERGIDPLLPHRASLRAVQLILETAGGELLTGAAEAGHTGYIPKKISLRLSRLQEVLGVEFPTAKVVAALERLHLSPVLRENQIEVTVPSYRLDLNLEIDLVEEVARVIGYDQVPVRDQISIRLPLPDPNARTIETIRSTLVAGGYFEAVTVGFISDLLAGDFVPPEADKARPLPSTSSAVRKADASLRPSILPGLLEAVRRNETAGTEGTRFFEIGSTFHNDPAGRLQERRRLAIVGSPEAREVRGVIEALLGKLDASRAVKIVPDPRPGFSRGASGRIEWGGEPIGYLGLIDPAIAAKLSLRQHPVGAELELAPLLSLAVPIPQLSPLPRFPAMRRDLSFVLPDTVRYDALESVVRGLNPQWMEDLEYVTTYRGKPLEKGTKSVTVTLIFRSPTETLTSEQVEASVNRVVQAVGQELKATLRV